MLRTTLYTIILGTLSLFAVNASAASISLIPATGELGIGKEISIDVKINTEETGINAAQATLRFPKDVLVVKSIDKTDSVFNFWLEEPSFSNTDGVITFVGGTPYGVSGSSLQVLHIVFTAVTAGSAPITIIDSAITASDGSGTNVLSKTNQAILTVSPKKTTPAVVIPPPTQIVRQPTPASSLPQKPVITVPLYSDPNAWSGNANIFTATWDLPNDISAVATALNKHPSDIPQTNEGLFNNKSFQSLTDGIWYLHVQFKNSAGWGPTAHYRIAVDTKAPLPFEIIPQENAATDIPTPTFKFKAEDTLSGIHEYRIKIDSGDWVTIDATTFDGTYKLPKQIPGKHQLTIRALDNAGNSIENTFDFETLPLPNPSFTFTPDKVFSENETGLSFSGTALPSTDILINLMSGATVISSNITPVDTNGNWEFTFSNPLRNGTYYATIQNRDTRGAVSLVATSTEIQVTGKYTNLIISLIVFLIVVIVSGGWYYKRHREKLALRINIAENDTAKVFKMIQDDVQKLQDAQKTPTMVDDEFITEKLKKNVEKMSKYLKDTIIRAKD